MFPQKSAAVPLKIIPSVYMVGGPDLSDPRDCLCYLAMGTKARVLIDCGAGPSAGRILHLAQEAAGQPPTHLLITHAHIDHAGGAAKMRRLTGCQVLIHQGDEETLSRGDSERSAAHWYGLELEPAPPDITLCGGENISLGGQKSLRIVHTPGHTPGSIAAWGLMDGQKILFGQDIHGPFAPGFGSDMSQWRRSMQTLLDLDADILAEGHYGVFKPAPQVASFIKSQLDLNA